MLVAPKHSDYTYEPSIAVPKKSRQAKKKLPARVKFVIVSFVGLMFVVGLALTSRVVLYFYRGYEIARLNGEIEALQTDNERLKLEIEQLCSLNRIENLALNKLGMVKPDTDDIEMLPINENPALASKGTGTNDSDNSADSPAHTEEQPKDSLLAVWSEKLSSLFVQIVEASEL